MIRVFLARRENFRRLLRATESVGEELSAKSYEFWQSQQAPEMHFHRDIDGLAMHFDIDWHKRKDGSLFVDIVGSGSLPTIFGVRPRHYFVVKQVPK